MRWCERSNWIHVSTTPFYSGVRYAGSAVGLALVLPIAERQDSKDTKRDTLDKKRDSKDKKRDTLDMEDLDLGEQILRVIIGVICGLVIYTIHILMPKTDLRLFYVFETVLNVFSVFVIGVFVPYVSRKCFGVKNVNLKKQNKKEKKRN